MDYGRLTWTVLEPFSTAPLDHARLTYVSSEAYVNGSIDHARLTYAAIEPFAAASVDRARLSYAAIEAWMSNPPAITPNAWGGGIGETTDPYGVYEDGFTDGSPHIIAMRRDGTDRTIWRDGVQVVADTVASTTTSSAPIAVGCRTTDIPAHRLTDGRIAEVLVYETALSDEDLDKVTRYLKSKWFASGGAWRLTFYTVDRDNTVADYTFSPDDYFDIQQLSQNIAGIRNAITVTYMSSSILNADGSPSKQSVSAVDLASIAKYGRRWMGITEASTSHIDTDTEANAMAAACLMDLREPVATHVITMPAFPFAELGDLYTFTANGVHYDEAQTGGVVAIRHTFTKGKAETSLTMRSASPVGRTDSWYWFGNIRGNAPASSSRGIDLDDWDISEGFVNVRALTQLGRDSGMEFEIHGSIFGAFTPDNTTYLGRARGTTFTIPTDASGQVPVGELRYFCLVPIDKYGNRGNPTTIKSATALRTGPQHQSYRMKRQGMHGGAVFLSTSRGSDYPPDMWNMTVGSWGTDAIIDEGTEYSSPLTGDQGMLLMNTSVATKMTSDPVPVTPGTQYLARITFKQSGDCDFTGTVEWLTDALGFISATAVGSEIKPRDVDTFITKRIVLQPPATASWARLVLQKNTTPEYVFIDQFCLDEYAGSSVGTTSIRLFDEFWGDEETSGSIGDLGWAFNVISGTSFTVTKPAVTTSAFDQWSETGLVKLSISSSTGEGGVLHLGLASKASLRGYPPEGLTFRVKVKFGQNLLNCTAWIGIWSDESTYPNSSGPLNVISGIGFRVVNTGSAAHWYGITSNGSSRSGVDLGITASVGSAGWYELGWRIVPTGVQFMVNGEDIGSPVTTDLPGSTVSLTPLMGLMSEGTDAGDRDLLVDYLSAEGVLTRY